MAAKLSLQSNLELTGFSGCGEQCQPPAPAESDKGTNNIFLCVKYVRNEVECKPSMYNYPCLCFTKNYIEISERSFMYES